MDIFILDIFAGVMAMIAVLVSLWCVWEAWKDLKGKE